MTLDGTRISSCESIVAGVVVESETLDLGLGPDGKRWIDELSDFSLA